MMNYDGGNQMIIPWPKNDLKFSQDVTTTSMTPEWPQEPKSN